MSANLNGMLSNLESTMQLWTGAMLALPLIAAAVTGLLLRRRHCLGMTVSVGTALALAALTFVGRKHFGDWQRLSGEMALQVAWPWFQLGSLRVELAFLLSPASLLMISVVNVIGSLIHVFSMGYMKGDEGKSRYFAGLSLFVFSMNGIALANDLLLLFVFWELVGFCSWMLICHYHSTEVAPAAARKAFIVNRIGDVGFIAGIIWALHRYETTNLTAIHTLVMLPNLLPVKEMGLLLMCGFLGKSAQFPLHVWLPDAMAGPTPVSALIHAATMVAAGIYMLTRIFPLLTLDVLHVILWLCAAMVIYAGVCAVVQRDIKKVLAYSTLAQLGYMGVAVGLAMPGLALFHMGTHACFKALLFLGAGSVIHALHHEQDIFRMGGLLKKMPITGACFLVGAAALCGLPLTAGHASKEAILQAASLQGPAGIFWALELGAALTALYTMLLVGRAFLGNPCSEAARHAHENGITIFTPLILLAGFSLVAGLPGFWREDLWPVFEGELMHLGHIPGKFPTVAAAGMAIALGVLYLERHRGSAGRETPFRRFVRSGMGFDMLYGVWTNGLQQRMAELLAFLDVTLIGGLLVRGTAGVTGFLGVLLRSLQTGNVQVYAWWFLGGMVLLWGLLSGWFVG